MHMRLSVAVLVCVCLLSVLAEAGATLSKRDKRTSKKKEDERDEVTLPTTTVLERGLVTSATKWKDIVSHHGLYSGAGVAARQLPPGTLVLGYVTPWNSHGYDVAKLFAAKFTHISPVWLQLKRQLGASYSIEGTHDIDQGWVKAVRASAQAGGSEVKILPRLLFEGWGMSDFTQLFASAEKREELADHIAHVYRHHEFDGVVLEVWSQLGGRHKSELASLVKVIAEHLHKKHMELILVAPSSKRGSMFTDSDFVKLSPHVDGFSLMTYDYSQPGSPGPNSPLHWVDECVVDLCPLPSPERAKILTGLNFYGYDFTATKMDPIVGGRYLELLQKYKPKFQWDGHCAEHHFDYNVGNVRHEVYFPTLKSIQERLKLAQDLGSGISIWEIGQGLDYFYDLL